ncbi:Hypothetical predicted protein [Mytilus galloprovincialis]|uniref:Uncharacterized protein n=1 Tax=Mytilus galloprovincialis TaxID=29158 RepID=A0A8B6ERY9_MYTGA|nr:Hypothetical predicted protein [Mytilus galloprovincialis]
MAARRRPTQCVSSEVHNYLQPYVLQRAPSRPGKIMFHKRSSNYGESSSSPPVIPVSGLVTTVLNEILGLWGHGDRKIEKRHSMLSTIGSRAIRLYTLQQLRCFEGIRIWR